METKEIFLLHAKYLQNSLNADESIAWLSAINDHANEELLKSLMKDTWEQVKHEKKQDMPLSRSNEVLNTITSSPMIKIMPNKILGWRGVAIAASILLIASLSFYFYSGNVVTNDSKIAIQQDINPAKNGATLTLANGKKILIKDALVGSIASQSGVKISKTADGQLIYVVSSEQSDERTGTGVQYNTLSTTRGEQTQVRLPDGTLVFLNAESSLRFPTSFAKLEKRQVSLTGEGYFEVAKDKMHPFIVQTNQQEIEVLGTHFNVNSYKDESAIATTLMEGSVKIVSAGVQKVIKPGEQALNNNGSITVNTVDLESIIDWKNGDFYLDKVPFKVAMRKIARWYNVDVVYDVSILDDMEAGGWISRNSNLSSILKVIESSGLAHFKVEGRTIYVYK